MSLVNYPSIVEFHFHYMLRLSLLVVCLKRFILMFGVHYMFQIMVHFKYYVGFFDDYSCMTYIFNERKGLRYYPSLYFFQ